MVLCIIYSTVWYHVYYVYVYSMVSAQQTNLLPENIPKTAPFLPKSLYHSRTTSQCISSCGCTITILYTYVNWLTPHQQGQELHVSWPCHLMDGCLALPNMAGLLMCVKKTKTTASTMSWSPNSPLGSGGLVHHSPNSPLGFGGLVPLSLLST